MMRYLRRFSKSPFKILLRLKTRSAISRLCNETDGVLNLLGDALKETLKNDVSQEEKLWIDKIESLREELNSSATKISIVDYGAGTPRLRLTDEEMYAGRVVNKTIGKVCRNSSKSYFWSLLLFKLIRKFKPSFCLELGTCFGISASFQAAALKLNGMGKIVTLEGAEPLAALAKEHFHVLGLDNVSVVAGKFQDTLKDVLDAYVSVNYAFIDGHHDEKATLAYFRQIIPFLSGRALLIFDDISWSAGMKRAWNTIRADERIKISLDLKQIGVCIIDNETLARKSITIRMFRMM
jgi:predicted O-methyltransferase YrrM